MYGHRIKNSIFGLEVDIELNLNMGLLDPGPFWTRAYFGPGPIWARVYWDPGPGDQGTRGPGPQGRTQSPPTAATEARKIIYRATFA